MQPQFPDGVKQRASRLFAERVRQGNLGRDVRLVYYVVGGMPSTRAEYKINVDSLNGVQIEVYDLLHRLSKTRASISPKEFDVASLFKQICAGLHSLLQESFPPGALLGRLTISVECEQETFSFVPEPEKRTVQINRVAPSMELALQRLWDIAQRVIEEHQGGLP
ncbi:hypothetical protein [Paraburkholderia sp. 22B1P]|uniref:hypothetical protein n=1 Tax=Paraburkholderia sp. 22B1P TaxID=3080498 RepID=UPI00309354DC|nr:hypothetical protein PBP221_81790 [Paraburkholderia sp. 22B1P]